MRSRLWIVLWIVGILFPMGFAASLWPPFERAFTRTFSTAWSHIAMHAFLYFVLAILLTQALRPASLRAVLLLLGLALAVAVCQEALQWLTIRAEIGWSASAFDLLVDLGGALAGLGAARVWSTLRSRSAGTPG